ncbi:acyl carrier protein [Frisingicoccus sp.]|uniref:acyl carrier protein n=1 Tax=Frisingicoccus sp. TaxID=1918627 RepID=UPI002E7704A9|nr:acyl carrier protein [Frisingicoccus sp.]MEE0752437.1 acyl carrier protein [Frisingicoccus sp.]
MFEKIRNIIVDELGVDAGEVTPEASFKDDLGADSLDLVELVMGLEDAFDASIPTEDLEKLSTVQDVMDYLKAQGVEE